MMDLAKQNLRAICPRCLGKGYVSQKDLPPVRPDEKRDPMFLIAALICTIGLIAVAVAWAFVMMR